MNKGPFLGCVRIQPSNFTHAYRHAWHGTENNMWRPGEELGMRIDFALSMCGRMRHELDFFEACRAQYGDENQTNCAVCNKAIFKQPRDFMTS